MPENARFTNNGRDHAGSSTGWFARCWDTFRNVLLTWCFVFLLVLFPLDLLFRIDSFVKFLSFMGIARICSGIIILFTALAIMAALVCGAAAMLPVRIKGITASSALVWLSTLVACTFSMHVFMQITLLWITKVTSSQLNVDVRLPTIIKSIAFTFSLLLFILNKETPSRFLTFTQRSKRLIAVILFLSVSITAHMLLTADRNHQGERARLKADEKEGKVLPNIILVTFDALSADHMSIYGYGRKTTPNFDAFCESANVFTTMIANGNWTPPTTASLILGKYPLTHRISYITPDEIFPYRHENLANLLKNAGYKTAMVGGNLGNESPKRSGTFEDFDCIYDFNEFAVRSGINLYITNYLDVIDINSINFKPYWGSVVVSFFYPYYHVLLSIFPAMQSSVQSSARFNSAAPHFAKAARLLLDSREPLFLRCHVFPPHDPYLPSSMHMYTFLKEHVLDTKEKQDEANKLSVEKPYVQLRDRYDELILSADEEFGAFIRTLQKQVSYDNAIIIVSADHGEVFTPTFVGHNGNNLPDPLIHIPLAIHLPGQTGKKIVMSPAEQVDIAPTILDYLGLNIPDWIEGESLRPAIETEMISQKPKFSMNLDSDSIHGPVRYGVVAVIKDGYKLIHNFRENSCKLYNLKVDHQEINNLAEWESERVQSMYGLIRDRIALSERNRGHGDMKQLSLSLKK